jgi:hypothetical protein
MSSTTGGGRGGFSWGVIDAKSVAVVVTASTAWTKAPKVYLSGIPVSGFFK